MENRISEAVASAAVLPPEGDLSAVRTEAHGYTVVVRRCAYTGRSWGRTLGERSTAYRRPSGGLEVTVWFPLAYEHTHGRPTLRSRLPAGWSEAQARKRIATLVERLQSSLHVLACREEVYLKAATRLIDVTTLDRLDAAVGHGTYDDYSVEQCQFLLAELDKLPQR